jgi:1-deoxy-D-xylulose-5-phosphate synthase
MIVMTPSDENECRQMLTTACQSNAPCAVRYPRGSGIGAPIDKALTSLPLGKGELRRKGEKIALLAFGTMLAPAMAAGETLNASVANMRFVKPIDRELILALAREHSLLVSIEENVVIGGAGAEVARVLEEAGSPVRFLRIGLPDRFIDHGDQTRLLAEIGLDQDGILRQINTYLNLQDTQ